MLGLQPLRRFEKLLGLLRRVAEGFERAYGFILIGVRRGLAQRLGPIARELGGILFGARLGGGNYDPRGPAQILDRAAATTGGVDNELTLRWNFVQQSAE